MIEKVCILLITIFGTIGIVVLFGSFAVLMVRAMIDEVKGR